MLDHSPEATRGVLRGLFGWAADDGGELIEVSVKSPRGRWKTQQWEPADLFDAENIKRLAWWSGEGREVYVGCVGLTAHPDKAWRRGGASLRGHAGALWLDVDCQAPGREGQEFFTDTASAVEAVDAALGDVLAGASLVIGSGWGVQYWIPLGAPVPGADASRLVRVLVGFMGAATGKKIDRVWDVTRVMRMPGTLNWRAGPEPETAQWAGVLRWPGREYAGAGRLPVENVIAVLGARVTEVLGPLVIDVPAAAAWQDPVDALLARFYPDTGGGGSGDGGGWEPVGEVLGDLERIADEVLTWPEVLEPHGWTCVTEEVHGDTREQVWSRPGKESGHPERSAVVYADRPELLVVYSDSPQCGFADGLRGSGRRGDGAGVGVISRWRAWVDLAWGGDAGAASAAVRDGGDGVGSDPVRGKLGEAWATEMDGMEEWYRELEWTVLMNPHLANP